MHLPTRSNPTLDLVVRAQVAGVILATTAVDHAQRRMERLREHGEDGAQAAEYAMLAGVSAAACGALVTLLKNKDFLEQVLSTVVSALTKSIKTWF